MKYNSKKSGGKKRQAFPAGITLIEVVMVILVVAILAAAAIPIMRGRTDSAKWSEGRALMGTIATSIRAYIAEHDEELESVSKSGLGYRQLGMQQGDFDGTYFSNTDFEWNVDYSPGNNILIFTVTADRPQGIMSPDQYMLTQNGEWTAVVF